MKFIAIEGLDGVGKTTIAREISQRTGENLTLVSGGMTPGWAEVNLFVHYLYYLHRNFLNGRRGGIVDSHVLRTITAHIALGMSGKLAKITQPLAMVIAKPEINFLLDCSHEERIRRLVKKQPDHYDVQARVNGLYQEWADRLGYRVIEIDASPPIDQVARAIIEIINE